MIRLYVVMCTLFASTVVWAAEATEVAVPVAATVQKWWQALLVPVASTLGVILAAFLSMGLLKLVKLAEKKWAFDVPASIEALMTEKARVLVAWAEEKMETRVLHEDGVKTPGAERISEVTKALFSFAAANGYDEAWTAEKCQQLAEGVLHLERSPGVGSTDGRAAAITEKLSDKPA